MTKIPEERMVYFERSIYLPMLLIVLEKDYKLVKNGEFKLKHPYMLLIEQARLRIEQDLKVTKAYLLHHQMYVIKNSVDELFTEYHFQYDQLLEVRRYSNIRLRNHCAELLKKYLNN